jgi:hypothetical protein
LTGVLARHRKALQPSLSANGQPRKNIKGVRLVIIDSDGSDTHIIIVYYYRLV